MLKSLKTAALATSLAVTLSVSAVQAKELSIAVCVPPSVESYEPYRVMSKMLPEMTNGELTMREIGMEVVNLKNAVDSLQSGITDTAHVLTLYAPADFPNAVFVSELASFGANGQVMAAAVTEFILNCPECQSDFNKLGLVYTGGVATPTYHILSTKPVRSLADLEGLRLRSGGSPFSRWATEMGAVPVQMSSNDQYEAIQNGLLDGTLNPDSALIGGRLNEVVKYVTEIPVGTFHAAMNFTMRKAAWKGLTPEQRKGFMHAAVLSAAAYHPLSVETGDRGIKEAAADGLEVLQPEQDLIDANNAFQESEVATIAEIGRDRYGVKDPEQKIEYFRSLVDKWTKIFDERGYDAETVGNAIFEELWTNIDYSTYGL
jgi:TRAP-type C4-dicarboxylate transport system substrate-binding protein